MDKVLGKLSTDFKSLPPKVRKTIKSMIKEASEENPDWMKLVTI